MSGSVSLADLLAVEDFQFGRKPKGLARLDPRLKLFACFVLVMVNVLWPRPAFSLGLLLFSWAGLALTRVPLRAAAWFVFAPAWAMSLVVLGYALGFGHTVLGHWGPLTFYKEGLKQGGASGLRVLAEMACAASLVLSTPFPRLLNALRWFKVPEILVETLSLMYRYLFLLWDENASMRAAARVRGGYASRIEGFKTSGSILGSIFIRAYDRSQRIAQAIRARGGE